MPQASIALVFDQVKRMLQRFGINGVTEHALHDVTENHQNAVSRPGVRVFAGYMYLPVEAVLPFHENVGFRLCAHKQRRAAVAAAFFRARAYSCEQRQRFIERVRELTVRRRSMRCL